MYDTRAHKPTGNKEGVGLVLAQQRDVGMCDTRAHKPTGNKEGVGLVHSNVM